MKLDGNNLNHTEQTSRCIFEFLERFAPVTEIKTTENPSDWITNTKMPSLNEINFFETRQNRLVITITKSTKNNVTWLHHY